MDLDQGEAWVGGGEDELLHSRWQLESGRNDITGRLLGQRTTAWLGDRCKRSPRGSLSPGEACQLSLLVPRVISRHLTQ